MVPVQMRTLEHDVGYHAENSQRNAFLNHLQLYEVKGTAVLHKAQSIGGHLTTILKKGNHPRKGDDTNQGPVA
jgi:hypothetical protein